jgi:hypothetical protein
MWVVACAFAALTLAACTKPLGHALDLTLTFDGTISDDLLAQVTSFTVRSMGDEQGVYPVPLGRPASRSERIVYDAALSSQSIAIEVDAASARGTTSFAGGNTKGNVIVVAIMLLATLTDSVTGVTDTESNTYTRVAGAGETDDNNNAYYEYWSALVEATSASNNVITVAPAAGVVFAAEYGGVATANALDSSAGASHIAAPYTITAANPGDLVVSVAGFQGSGVNWTVSGTDRSGVTNVFFEYNDFVGVAGPNSISVSTSQGATAKPGGFSIALKR